MTNLDLRHTLFNTYFVVEQKQVVYIITNEVGLCRKIDSKSSCESIRAEKDKQNTGTLSCKCAILTVFNTISISDVT